MVFKGEHGRNHVHKYQMNLLQGDNYFKRSFHDKVYIVSMGMNTGFMVDSHLFNA